MTDNIDIDVAALAALARLEVPEAELETLDAQIPAILSFVARIQEVAEDTEADKNPVHKNIMRSDDHTHESGAYTETLLKAMPRREGDYLRVPQVIKGGKHA
ncbi:MAG: Asp-tRNA(Asn)/Glu-tRNA(Gln) amidotransferase subunit GatC [Parcubacteria group bacterium]|nr:Asp-tRNA(Asn)/Glu-tRNA(Gln) amidotransferase subunit GatC [Parcubacteria group bacterium]